MRGCFAPLCVVLLAGATAQAAPPWAPRKPGHEPRPAHQLKDVERWPSEPATPDEIDADRFVASVAYVCRRPAEAVSVMAKALLDASEESEIDPFVLAALTYERSQCDPRWRKHGGLGLLAIEPRLYRVQGAPKPPCETAELAARRLMDPIQNLRLGARLLRMWEEAHEDLDVQFGGARHRSGLAHFYWGDRVGSSGAEDLVFTTRRRLLSFYNSETNVARATPAGLAVVSPLEGVPRVATSGPGDDRDGGVRRHRGLDIAASEGEPVHAIASGVVIFAGANLKGSPRREIPPARISRYVRRRFGAGGIYVCIRHDAPSNSGKEVVSCYMHLSGYQVAKDAVVTAGQPLGWVGRTGVLVSPTHLHLEIRVDGRIVNPARYLADLVIPPGDTLTHSYNVAAQRARLRSLRAAARAARSSLHTAPVLPGS